MQLLKHFLKTKKLNPDFPYDQERTLFVQGSNPPLLLIGEKSVFVNFCIFFSCSPQKMAKTRCSTLERYSAREQSSAALSWTSKLSMTTTVLLSTPAQLPFPRKIAVFQHIQNTAVEVFIFIWTYVGIYLVFAFHVPSGFFWLTFYRKCGKICCYSQGKLEFECFKPIHFTSVLTTPPPPPPNNYYFLLEPIQ